MFNFLSQTLKALHYLHTRTKPQPIVHLDLKPENVILDTKSNTVKLIDFGCAQSLHQLPNLRTNHVYESTEFLAPELVNQNSSAGSRDLGTHTDMWAFAVLLYVALR